MTKQYFPTSKGLDDDTEAMKTAIRALNDAEVFFYRPTRHQLKSGSVSFYPDRGTIFIDGQAKAEADLGIKAFIRRGKIL